MITLLCLFIGLMSAPLEPQGGGTSWVKDKKLQWSDFQGNVPANAPDDIKAKTTSSVTYSFASVGSDIKFSTQCTFDHQNSWVRSGSNSAVLLKHEQKHFDLAEFQRRLFVEKVKTAKFKSINTIVDEIAALATEAADEVDALQDLYDEETDHSRKATQQGDWEKKIENMMAGSEDHAAVEFVISIDYLMK